MRCFIATLLLVSFSVPAWAGQPHNIRLDPNGVSLIYPVLDTAGWLLTQPAAGKVFDPKDTSRLTHWADDYYAQDWARGCGKTSGARLYAGISGQVVMAGFRSSYGNTVVVYNAESRFALKYAHLSEISVAVGDYVLAGKTFVGRVGNSGNARTGSCATDPGAHLHLVLYKNVVDVNARPITLTSASSGVGPTVFAAPFGYTTQADLAKAANDPTVYVLKDGQRIPVSAASYESHGWNFDKYESVFRPLQNRIFSTSELGRLAQSYYFWPLRDSALLKSSNNPTVYLFEEGRKSALDYQTFTCRGFRFGEILEVRPAERDDYLPIDDVPANGCVSASLQSLRDMAGFAVRYGFVSPDLSSYGYSSDWNHGWNLRWLVFRHTSGMLVTIFHASVQHNTSERYTAYSDPVTGGWSGWQRIY